MKVEAILQQQVYPYVGHMVTCCMINRLLNVTNVHTLASSCVRLSAYNKLRSVKNSFMISDAEEFY
jgi:hypothetical protein